MNNKRMPFPQRQFCLNCMKGYIVNGRCQFCGKNLLKTPREDRALPYDYRLKMGRYRVGRVLGQGGFGITYLAWDNHARRRVALKELFPTQISRSPGSQSVLIPSEMQGYFNHVKKRFIEESGVISQLRSEPSIINVYDSFEENGTAYYAMEFLEGSDLQHLLKQQHGMMSWQSLEQPVKQVMKGLETLHGYGLIHRDISPDNIFVCSDGRTKLIDFGSTRRLDARRFTTILKADFAPPELYRPDGNQGFWSDTFSFCATLYYLLSRGNHPPRAEVRYSTLQSTGKDPLVPLRSWNPNAPEHVMNAIVRGLSLDIEKRFQSVDELRNGLFPSLEQRKTGMGVTLNCIRGVFSGRSFYLHKGKYASLGRGAGTNAIGYPDDPEKSPGISRRHCVFFVDQVGRLYVQDQQSRYGTVVGGNRIQPLTWVEVAPGQSIILGGEEYIVIIS